MEELFRRLRASARPEGSYEIGEYGHSYNVLTYADAENIIRYLKQYIEIQRIIEEFYDAPDCHCGRGNPRDSMAESFERILDIFKE